MSIKVTKMFIESLKSFIVDNWSYISFGLVFVLEFILLILKRRKVTPLTDSQLDQIIKWIKDAESLFGSSNGDKKREYVLDQFKTFYPVSNVEDWVLKFEIERILSLPTKKGGLGREKDK